MSTSTDGYVTAFSSGVMAEPDTFDHLYRVLLKNVVHAADANGDGDGDGDGKLNKAEYLQLMQTWYNADEPDAVEAFYRLDRDDDGFVTRNEMVRSATDFYLSDDPILPSALPRHDNPRRHQNTGVAFMIGAQKT